jgi:raffinose/stachyose/melibiose transport system permease protein
MCIERIKGKQSPYSYGFLIPAAIIYGVVFLVPTIMSLFFSLTRWTLTDWSFVGLQNFREFFGEFALTIAIKNTLVYAFSTCALKVILALLLAVLLTGTLRSKNWLRAIIFFPSILSMLAVGMAFSSLMHPSKGLINTVLHAFGIHGPNWLGNTSLVLFSLILVDTWKGIGISMVIYIAGIQSIPQAYYEAATIDGAGSLQKLLFVTIPLVRPAMNSVIILSLIGGLKTFGLIWAMTQGGPGYASDVLASVIYKQYVNGYYGLSLAGNVILLVLVSMIALPLYTFLNRNPLEY